MFPKVSMTPLPMCRLDSRLDLLAARLDLCLDPNWSKGWCGGGGVGWWGGVVGSGGGGGGGVLGGVESLSNWFVSK